MFFYKHRVNRIWFFQSEPRQYAYQFGQYAYIFSKRASGMLINDMLIKKTCISCKNLRLFALDWWYNVYGLKGGRSWGGIIILYIEGISKGKKYGGEIIFKGAQLQEGALKRGAECPKRGTICLNRSTEELKGALYA